MTKRILTLAMTLLATLTVWAETYEEVEEYDFNTYANLLSEDESATLLNDTQLFTVKDGDNSRKMYQMADLANMSLNNRFALYVVKDVQIRKGNYGLIAKDRPFSICNLKAGDKIYIECSNAWTFLGGDCLVEEPSAGTTVTSGTTYTVKSNIEGTTHLDLKGENSSSGSMKIIRIIKTKTVDWTEPSNTLMLNYTGSKSTLTVSNVETSINVNGTDITMYYLNAVEGASPYSFMASSINSIYNKVDKGIRFTNQNSGVDVAVTNLQKGDEVTITYANSDDSNIGQVLYQTPYSINQACKESEGNLVYVAPGTELISGTKLVVTGNGSYLSFHANKATYFATITIKTSTNSTTETVTVPTIVESNGTVSITPGTAANGSICTTYYTTDGTPPTSESTAYTEPFIIDNSQGDVTIKAITYINGLTNKSDIASTVIEAASFDITVNQTTGGTFTVKVGDTDATDASTTAKYGQTITLDNTPANGYTFTSYSVTKTNGTDVIEVNNNQFTMPSEAVTITATFTEKTAPTVTNLAAASLTYNGQPQNLVTTPTVTGGTIFYATESEGDYTTTIPQGTDAGNYSVWYKLTGDASHTDIGATEITGVSIAKYNIENATGATAIEDQTATGSQITPAAPAIKMGETTIDAENYDVSYGTNTDVGTGSVTYTAKEGSTNFTGTKTLNFNIVASTPVTHTLTVGVDDASHGSAAITVNEAAANSGDPVAEGASVTVTATANSGYTFKNWGSTELTSNPYTFTMGSSDVTLTATFVEESTGTEVTVSTEKTWIFNDYSEETINSNQLNDGLYTRAYTGRSWTISAVESQNLTIGGKEISVSKIAKASGGMNTPNTLSLKTANENTNSMKPAFAFNTSVAGTCYVLLQEDAESHSTGYRQRIYFGDGTNAITCPVSSNGAGNLGIEEISYTSTSAGTFVVGATGSACKIYAIRFVPVPRHKLTVTSEAQGSVTVMKGNNDVTTAVATGADFDEGSSFILTATSNSGYAFDKWTDGNGEQVSTDNPYTINSLSEDLTLKANYREKVTYTFSVTNISSAEGTVTAYKNDEESPWTIVSPVDEGTKIKLVATPNEGYNFVSWKNGEDVVSADATYIIESLSQNMTLTATYISSSSVVPVILTAGQSNTDGRISENIPSDFTGLQHCYWSYCNAQSVPGGTFEEAYRKYTPVFSLYSPASDCGANWAYDAVVYDLVGKALNSDFYVIKQAKGNTSISPDGGGCGVFWGADKIYRNVNSSWGYDETWFDENTSVNSGGLSLLKGFIENIDASMSALEAQGKLGDIKFMLWHQGECDSKSGNTAFAYYENLKAVVNYVRNYLATKYGEEYRTLPFICGTVAKNSGEYHAYVENALYRLQKDLTNFYVINMSLGTFISDGVHFNQETATRLGKKMYNKIVENGYISGSTVEVEDIDAQIYNDNVYDFQNWANVNTEAVTTVGAETNTYKAISLANEEISTGSGLYLLNNPTKDNGMQADMPLNGRFALSSVTSTADANGAVNIRIAQLENKNTGLRAKASDNPSTLAILNLNPGDAVTIACSTDAIAFKSTNAYLSTDETKTKVTEGVKWATGTKYIVTSGNRLELTFGNSSGQTFLYSVKINPGEVKETVSEPEITVDTETCQVIINSTTTELGNSPAIYFTTDGLEPTTESGTLYTEPFTSSQGTTIKAVATVNGLTSNVVEKLIEAETIEKSESVVYDFAMAEEITSTNSSGHTRNLTYKDQNGYTLTNGFRYQMEKDEHLRLLTYSSTGTFTQGSGITMSGSNRPFAIEGLKTGDVIRIVHNGTVKNATLADNGTTVTDIEGNDFEDAIASGKEIKVTAASSTNDYAVFMATSSGLVISQIAINKGIKPRVAYDSYDEENSKFVYQVSFYEGEVLHYKVDDGDETTVDYTTENNGTVSVSVSTGNLICWTTYDEVASDEVTTKVALPQVPSIEKTTDGTTSQVYTITFNEGETLHYTISYQNKEQTVEYTTENQGKAEVTVVGNGYIEYWTTIGSLTSEKTQQNIEGISIEDDANTGKEDDSYAFKTWSANVTTEGDNTNYYSLTLDKTAAVATVGEKEVYLLQNPYDNKVIMDLHGAFALSDEGNNSTERTIINIRKSYGLHTESNKTAYLSILNLKAGDNIKMVLTNDNDVSLISTNAHLKGTGITPEGDGTTAWGKENTWVMNEDGRLDLKFGSGSGQSYIQSVTITSHETVTAGAVAVDETNLNKITISKGTTDVEGNTVTTYYSLDGSEPSIELTETLEQEMEADATIRTLTRSNTGKTASSVFAFTYTEILPEQPTVAYKENKDGKAVYVISSVDGNNVKYQLDDAEAVDAEATTVEVEVARKATLSAWAYNGEKVSDKLEVALLQTPIVETNGKFDFAVVKDTENTDAVNVTLETTEYAKTGDDVSLYKPTIETAATFANKFAFSELKAAGNVNLRRDKGLLSVKEGQGTLVMAILGVASGNSLTVAVDGTPSWTSTTASGTLTFGQPYEVADEDIVNGNLIITFNKTSGTLNIKSIEVSSLKLTAPAVAFKEVVDGSSVYTITYKNKDVLHYKFGTNGEEVTPEVATAGTYDLAVSEKADLIAWVTRDGAEASDETKVTVFAPTAETENNGVFDFSKASLTTDTPVALDTSAGITVGDQTLYRPNGITANSFGGHFAFSTVSGNDLRLIKKTDLRIASNKNIYIAITGLKAGKILSVTYTGGTSADTGENDYISFVSAANIDGVTDGDKVISGTIYTVNADGDILLKASNANGSMSITSVALDAETVTAPAVTLRSGFTNRVTITPGTSSYGNTVTTYYTIDGSTPTTESDSFTDSNKNLGPYSANMTIKAYSVSSTGVKSTVTTFNLEVPFFTVTLSEQEGGTVTADKTAEIAEGTTVRLKVTAAEGYHLTVLKVDGGAELAADNTFKMPAANVTVSATFEKDEDGKAEEEVRENVTIVDEDNAKVTSVVIGEDVTTVTISATVDNVPVTAISDKTFTADNTENVAAIDLSETAITLSGQRSEVPALQNINSATLIYLPESASVTGTNVVTKSGTGENATYSCEDYQLTDGKTSAVPHGFTATSAKINRTFTADKKSTVCLPYAITATGGTFYEFTGINNGKVQMTAKAENDELAANTPYIFMPSANVDGISAQNVEVGISDAPQTENNEAQFTFVGTYEPIVWNEPVGIYGFAAQQQGTTEVGQFVRVGSGASIAPFRAYLVYSGAGTLSNAPARRSMEDLPETLEIEWIPANSAGTTSITTMKQDDADADAPVYNMSGQRVDQSYKGMVIKNGKKVVRK